MAQYPYIEDNMGEKRRAFNKQGQNVQRQQGKFNKKGQNQQDQQGQQKQKGQKNWPVDEIAEES